MQGGVVEPSQDHFAARRKASDQRVQEISRSTDIADAAVVAAIISSRIDKRIAIGASATLRVGLPDHGLVTHRYRNAGDHPAKHAVADDQIGLHRTRRRSHVIRRSSQGKQDALLAQ